MANLVSMCMCCDGTHSMMECIERMKEVMDIILAIVEYGNTGWEVHIVVMSMRDWSDEDNLITVYTCKEESLKAGKIIPLIIDGTRDNYIKLHNVFQEAINGCYGGGDLCEEYSIGYNLALQYFKSQKILYNNHPCIMISIIDDAQHGFNDFYNNPSNNGVDYYVNGTVDMEIETKHPLGSYGKWKGIDITKTLREYFTEDIFTIFCLCGRASFQCKEWLNYLTIMMDESNGLGFVFTIDSANTQVPPQIATLILYNITMFYTPLENDDFDKRKLECSICANQILKNANNKNNQLNDMHADIDSLITGINKLACLTLPTEVPQTRSLIQSSNNDIEIRHKLREYATNKTIISKPESISLNNKYTSLGETPIYRSLGETLKTNKLDSNKSDTNLSNTERINIIANMFNAHSRITGNSR